MKKALVSWILIIGGLLVIALSAVADLIGLGTYPGFNTAQLLGVAFGLLVFIYGFRLRRKKAKTP